MKTFVMKIPKMRFAKKNRYINETSLHFAIFLDLFCNTPTPHAHPSHIPSLSYINPTSPHPAPHQTSQPTHPPPGLTPTTRPPPPRKPINYRSHKQTQSHTPAFLPYSSPHTPWYPAYPPPTMQPSHRMPTPPFPTRHQSHPTHPTCRTHTPPLTPNPPYLT